MYEHYQNIHLYQLRLHGFFLESVTAMPFEKLLSVIKKKEKVVKKVFLCVLYAPVHFNCPAIYPKLLRDVGPILLFCFLKVRGECRESCYGMKRHY
ncbi:hypothetical protein OUZ56_001927 [Daphnia magna]|uniref:Uncharacterized protein n=1 Tax=Daphnia magna TaxID=35525 RepID=A0ABR0A460_9CRUS|nr:hypothetical protein OUZ56_001927 [Daphnia magna]